MRAMGKCHGSLVVLVSIRGYLAKAGSIPKGAIQPSGCRRCSAEGQEPCVTSRLDLDMEEICPCNYTLVTGAPETCIPDPGLQFGHFCNEGYTLVPSHV